MQDLDLITGEGTGDMLKAVFDPAGKNAQLAADSEVLHLSTTEIITGAKTFNIDPLTPANTYTKEPTGFVEPENVVVNYDSTARTITLSGTVTAYWRGSLISALVDGWVSDPHDDTAGVWFLSYDGSSFSWANTVWTFDKVQIAFVYYSASHKFGIAETHGLMQWQGHKELHENIGTYKSSGGTITGITLSNTTPANRRPIISQTVIGDEDLDTTNALHNSALYTKFFLSSTGTANFTVETAEIIPLLVNNPYYNQFQTPNWIQTLFPSNSCGTVWLIGVPVTKDTDSQKYRYLFVQPQWITQAASGAAGALLTARNTENARTANELNLSALNLTEFVVFARFCVQYTSSNWTIENVTYLTGNKYNQTANPAGNFLVGINTSGKLLTGTGTPSNPLTAKNLDGFIDYNHSGSTQSYTTGDLKVLNDAVGAYTLKTYAPDSVTDLWNATTNQFDFSQLTLGDEVTIRTDGEVTTTANNQIFGTKLNMSIGANPYTLQVGQSYYKTIGTYPVTRLASFYIGNTDTLTNPAELMFYSDASATLKVTGYYISVKRRNS
jgi:hypothetical protein